STVVPGGSRNAEEDEGITSGLASLAGLAIAALAGLVSIRLISALSLLFSFSSASSRLRIASVVSSARTFMVLAATLSAIVAVPSKSFDLKFIWRPPAVASPAPAHLFGFSSEGACRDDVTGLSRYPHTSGPIERFALYPCCVGNID